MLEVYQPLFFKERLRGGGGGAYLPLCEVRNYIPEFPRTYFLHLRRKANWVKRVMFLHVDIFLSC